MEISQIADRLGLPQEKVALVMQTVREQGMPESQMSSMVQTALGKGLSASEIADTMASLGVKPESIMRVLTAQNAVDEAGEEALRERLGLAFPSCSSRGAPAREGAFDWRSFLKKAAIIAFWLAVWEAADILVDNRLVLAGPVRVAQALAAQAAQADFWLICAASFGRIASGFLLAFASGFLLALLCHKVRLARDFLDPVVSLLKTIPMASFVIMLLIWVGAQALTAYLAFLIVVPIVYTNVLAGLESADPQMLEMARVYRLSPWRTFLYVYRPAFMPFLRSGCKLSLGMSWKAGIMAEVLAVPALSIGKEMYTAKTFLDTPDLLAWTAVVMVLSLAFEKAFLALLARAARPMGSRLGSGEDAPVAALDAMASGGAEEAEAGRPLLGVRDISKSFGANRVLRDVSFELPAGVRCLMAPSGSGKTTLFRVLAGLSPADGGTVSTAGTGRISVMFQEDRLCETLTPVENVALALPRSASRAAVRGLLAEVLPAACLDQPVMELSGGMRRRVSLVRAVAYPAGVVVLDEPFTGLDAETRRCAIGFLLRHRNGRALLVATHGEDDARLLGAETLRLDDLQDGGGRR